MLIPCYKCSGSDAYVQYLLENGTVWESFTCNSCCIQKKKLVYNEFNCSFLGSLILRSASSSSLHCCVFLVKVDYATPLLVEDHSTHRSLATPFCPRSDTSIWRVMGCSSERISCSAFWVLAWRVWFSTLSYILFLFVFLLYCEVVETGIAGNGLSLWRKDGKGCRESWNGMHGHEFFLKLLRTNL